MNSNYKVHPTFTGYAVSKDGAVINKKTNKKLKPQTNEDGYLQIGLYKNKKRYFKLINRLVLETYNPIEDSHLYHAHHVDEVRDDNRLENLEWELKAEHLSKHHKGKVLSEEHKRKLLEANRGKVVSEETRRKIGEHHKGKVLSDETRRKISEAKKGVRRSDETRRKIGEGNKGKVISEETRRKISESMKRKHNQNKKLINSNKI